MSIKSYTDAIETNQELLDERSEWEAEWRQISNFILPGRGIYQNYAKPQKRKLTSPSVINPAAGDALGVLTSGMHGGLTSPSRPWFDLRWADERLHTYEPLKAWLQSCQKALVGAFHASNFYSVINSFYTEYAGFGTGSVFVGETGLDDVPFRFELLTAGEYSLAYGIDGRQDTYYRTLFMSPKQVIEKFPDASKDLKKHFKHSDYGLHVVDQTVLECVYKNKYQSKDFTQLYYLVTSTATGNSQNDMSGQLLGISGFYEMPYPTARWEIIGSDTYGLGPGSRALPDVKRLQEMERAFLMATHKTINPPLNAPARMRGKLNTLPGGYNFYANPNEKVEQLYQVQFDYTGVSAAVERVENRIQRNFFNDIFLTSARDPNASPLRTGQVQVQEQEKMLRLGPVIERLQNEFLQPLIERCFNIMLRNGLFPPLSPELTAMAGEYEIHLVSPLATAQRQVALSGINSFLAFVGQAAQFSQQVLDNIDIDKATREYADITGVQLGILRPEAQVQQLRQQRQQAMAEAQAKQEAQQNALVQSQLNAEQATAAKTQAEAGATLIDSQATARQMGMV